MSNRQGLSQAAQQLHMNLTELQPILMNAGLHKASDLLGDSRTLSAGLVEGLTPMDIVAGYRQAATSIAYDVVDVGLTDPIEEEQLEQLKMIAECFVSRMNEYQSKKAEMEAM